MGALAEFLLARIGEDEARAKAAAGGGRWRYSDGQSVGAWTLYDEHWKIASLETYRHSDYDYAARMPAFLPPDYVDADANGEHIAHWDPARVLAECAAKRAIVASHAGAHRRISGADPSPFDNVTVSLPEGRTYTEDGIDVTDDFAAWVATLPVEEPAVLRHLASVYADHPDYQREWAA